ncbi:MAG TPA: DNA polymerase I [Planctomycetaceae bacterium]|nr:DNA polymerase I [Planctomycetaceae bacterium]
MPRRPTRETHSSSGRNSDSSADSNRDYDHDLFGFSSDRVGEPASPTVATDSSLPTQETDGDRPTTGAQSLPSAEPTAKSTTALNETTAGKSVDDQPHLRVVLVDAHSLIYQLFHALPPMTSPAGAPVAAVHGFVGDMLELITRKSPTHLICAFDKSEVTFRNELYDQYKAHRESMPEDLRQQIPPIREIIQAMGIGVMECGGFEADDILATVAKQVESKGGTCLIVTADKDCRQLITDRVHLYNIRKNLEMTATELMADWGIRPDQVVDYQAMVGDPVDNVPGIPLVGPKLAQQLLTQFGDLQTILDNADSVSGAKRKENIKAGRERAQLSRTLVKLRDDVPCETPWDQSLMHADVPKLTAMLDEFGFRRLRTRIDEVFGRTGMAMAQPTATDVAQYQTITDLPMLDALVKRLGVYSEIAIDTETTGTDPRSSDLVGISIAWSPGHAAYIPILAPAGDPQLDRDEVINRLRPILENPNIGKIGQNIKFDLIVLRSAGANIQGPLVDTMVADYLIDPGRRNHTLDDLALRYLNEKTTGIKELIGSGKNEITMDRVPLAIISNYACEDVDVPIRIIPMARETLASLDLDLLFRDLEMPLIEVLAEMEFNGIRVDVDHLASMSSLFADRIERLRTEIFTAAGGEFNLDSPKQLAKVLFEDLGLPIVKKTKTGASTDVEVLQTLSMSHPLPARLIEYRQATKLKNTYIDALPRLVSSKTNRVHTSFRQDVAATGRLSSTEPNLQNIPIRTEEGRAIRGAFRAGPDGWLLMAADYSQIELRVLAHFSGDAALMDAYEKDSDIHTRVAAEVHGVEESAVTSDMRRVAKTINFGIVYGQSPFGLARTLGISKDEAAEYIELYFARYPGVQDFMLGTLVDCRKTGFVSTILGRRRNVLGVRDLTKLEPSKRRNLTEAERIAVNTVIQGSAADLIKKAMIHVYRRMAKSNLRAKLLLQIHDELVLEVDPEDAERLSELIREEMTHVMQLRVPLKVEIGTGKTWADVK